MAIVSQFVPAPPHPFADLDRLGDEIAELSAHLDAATARLLALIREFDARGGWNTGFSSCAAWLGWRVASTSGPLASGCGSRGRSARCRAWPRRWLAERSPTPTSAPLPASPRPRTKRG